MEGNTAPALFDAVINLDMQIEDSGAPIGAVGTLITKLVDLVVPAGGGDNVVDIDPGAVTGIALTGVDTAHGSWFYSIDGGANWLAVGSVSTGNALLLAADGDTRLYFRPSPDFNGQLGSAITFRAWDRTSGTEGSYVDTSVNGGGTAFSTATDTAGLFVDAVNDAPTPLDASVALPAILEDAVDPTGRTVHDIFRSHFSDGADNQVAFGGSSPGGLGGIAVVGNGSSASTGQWQYFVSGHWVDIGAASTSAAKLVEASTPLRFLPSADFNGPAPELVVRLIDNLIAVVDGAVVDTTVNGGSSTFSAQTIALTQMIEPVADAPVVQPLSGSEAEDNVVTLVLVASDVEDPDGSGTPPTFHLSELPGHGTLHTDLAGAPLASGTGYPAASYDPALHAWTLPVYFVPDANWSGTTSFHYSVTDDADTVSGTATATIEVTPVADPAIIHTHANEAPVPTGEAVQVTSSNQAAAPAVADLGGGRTLVVWQEGLFNTSIVGQVREANGVLGSPFQITPPSSPAEVQPSVAARPDGSFAVTWIEEAGDAGGGDIRTAFFAPGATSPLMIVATASSSSGREADPQLASVGNGYVVTWAVEHDGQADIRAQRYDAAGNPVGAAFTVSTGAAAGFGTGASFDPPDHSLASVGTDGAFVVVSDHGGVIEAKLVAANGTQTEIVVDNGGSGVDPIVTGLADGNFVVVWTQGIENQDILGRIYNSAGIAVTGELQLASSSTASEFTPSVAGLPDGRFVLSWVGNDGFDGTYDVFTQVYSASGVPNSGGPQVARATGDAISEGQPAIAVGDDGTYTIVWHEPGLWLRSYQPGPGEVTGHAGQATDLPLTIQLADTDGSERLSSVTIASVPDGFTFNAGAAGAPGSWIVDRSTPEGSSFLDNLAAGTAHFSMTAPAGYGGNVSLAFTAVTEEIDTGAKASTSAVLPIRFAGDEEGNSAPEARDDMLVATEDAAIKWSAQSLTGNDADQDGDTLSVAGVAGATHGTVTLNPDGSITFTPDADFSGAAGFDYILTDGHGGSDIGHVRVDVAPVNDRPVIVGIDSASATVTEDGGFYAPAGHVQFRDADPADTHVVTVGAPVIASSATVPAGLVPTGGFGSFEATALSEANGEGRFDWVYHGDNAAMQGLAAGETVTQTYSFAVADANSQSDSKAVTITLVGVNDGPTLSAESGDRAAAVLEEANAGLSAGGTLTAVDPDLSDRLAVSVAGFTKAGAVTGLGASDAALKAMLSLKPPVALSADPGEIHNLLWSFDSSGEAFDYLDDGETLTLTWTLLVTDGHGGSATKDVTVTIQGSNDAPVISLHPTDLASAALIEGDAPLIARGTLSVVDADASDMVDASVVAVSAPGLDEQALLSLLTLHPGHLAADPPGGLGNLGWTFTAGSGLFDYLGAGQTQTLTYTVRVVDDSGATDDQQIVITVSGTNDAPVVLAANPPATAVVEIADGDTDENAAVLIGQGKIYFSDADAKDGFSVSILPQQGGYLGSLIPTMASSRGVIDWSFTVKDSALDGLGQGEILRQFYTVTIGDGHGGSASQVIEVDLIGTNDAAHLSTSEVLVVQGSQPVSASGTLTISDIDGPALFQAEQSLHGRYGSLDLTAGGSWSYVADSAFAGLGTAEVLTDVFVVHAADGTPTTVTILIAGSDDVAIARPDNFVTSEAGLLGAGLSLFEDNGAGADLDPDSPLRIASVNGQESDVGKVVRLSSGALLKVNADGTFSYDPNHAFDTLTLASGAMNQFAYDSFSYALEGGSSTTVFVRVNGLNSPEDLLEGSVSDNAITGTPGPDIFRLEQGGNDTAWGLGSNDGFYFGAAFNSGDRVDGGDGTDTIALQGDTTVTLGDISNVEVILAMSGSDTRFGDIADARYDYELTTQDSNVAAGKTMTVQATGLLPGEDLHFNGAAETDGNFRIFAGQGNDVLIGGAGNDGFFFGADGNLTGTDFIDGAGGVDTIALRGNYVGADAVVFQDGSFTNVEVLALLSAHSNEYSGQIVATGFDYDVTLADGNVAAGVTFDVNGVRLGADESLLFDGSAETDGNYRILSGAGDDTLSGGAGNDVIWGALGADRLNGGGGGDTFVYRSAAESTSAGYDTITGFDWHVDRIDAPGGTRAFTQSGSGALSTGSFDADLAAGLNGLLGAGQAALFTATGGTLSGHVFAVIDANGVAGYQAGEDLVIDLVSPVLPIDPVAGVIF